jgi:hypothetical protein
MISDRKITTKEKLVGMLDSTLIPSLNGVELQKNSVIDFQRRLASKTPNIAELYHENSKLSQHLDKCILTDEETVKYVKNWYLSTTCKISEEDLVKGKSEDSLKDIGTFPEGLANSLGTLKGGIELDLLYSLDLLLLYEYRIYRYVPLSELLWLERLVDSDEAKTLKPMLIGETRDSIDEALGLIFVIGCPWRNMIFYGPRGYRNMLINAGYLIHHLSHVARDNELSLVVFQNFYDRKIDNFLNLDGVERFALAVIAVLCNNAEEPQNEPER